MIFFLWLAMMAMTEQTCPPPAFDSDQHAAAWIYEKETDNRLSHADQMSRYYDFAVFLSNRNPMNLIPHRIYAFTADKWAAEHWDYNYCED
jgi:hypothetical protein